MSDDGSDAFSAGILLDVPFTVREEFAIYAIFVFIFAHLKQATTHGKIAYTIGDDNLLNFLYPNHQRPKRVNKVSIC